MRHLPIKRNSIYFGVKKIYNFLGKSGHFWESNITLGRALHFFGSTWPLMEAGGIISVIIMIFSVIIVIISVIFVMITDQCHHNGDHPQQLILILSGMTGPCTGPAPQWKESSKSFECLCSRNQVLQYFCARKPTRGGCATSGWGRGPMQYHAMQSNTIQYHAIQWNNM